MTISPFATPETDAILEYLNAVGPMERVPRILELSRQQLAELAFRLLAERNAGEQLGSPRRNAGTTCHAQSVRPQNPPRLPRALKTRERGGQAQLRRVGKGEIG